MTLTRGEEYAMNWMGGCMSVTHSLAFLIAYLIEPLLVVFLTIPISITGFIYIFSALHYAKTCKGESK